MFHQLNHSFFVECKTVSQIMWVKLCRITKFLERLPRKISCDFYFVFISCLFVCGELHNRIFTQIHISLSGAKQIIATWGFCFSWYRDKYRSTLLQPIKFQKHELENQVSLSMKRFNQLQQAPHKMPAITHKSPKCRKSSFVLI